MGIYSEILGWIDSFLSVLNLLKYQDGNRVDTRCSSLDRFIFYYFSVMHLRFSNLPIASYTPIISTFTRKFKMFPIHLPYIVILMFFTSGANTMLQIKISINVLRFLHLQLYRRNFQQVARSYGSIYYFLGFLSQQQKEIQVCAEFATSGFYQLEITLLLFIRVCCISGCTHSLVYV